MSGDNMKAVAGMVSNTREMPLDDEDDAQEEGSDPPPPHFLPVIDRIRGLVNASVAASIRETPCFGHLWEDEAGTCPDAEDCQIAKQCKSVYDEVTSEEEEEAELEADIEHKIEIKAQVEEEVALEEVREAADAVIAASAQEAMDVIVDGTEPAGFATESITSPGALAASKKKKKSKKRGLVQRPKRGKFKGTGKYDRHGYYDMGRPVDASVRRFIHELDYPFELPKSWSPSTVKAKFGDKGRILVSKTSSYHSFIVDYEVVCRVWTNAAGYALCDLSPLLVAKLKTLKVDVQPIPSGSKGTKKYKNFDGRFYMKSEDDAERLAKWMLEVYKFAKTKPPAKKKTKSKQVTRKAKSNA